MPDHRQPYRDETKPTSWVGRHKWTLGVGAVALAVFWWRRSSRRDFSVSSVSEAWLAEHAVESGKSEDQPF